MSEFRDLTMALRSLSNRLTAVEDCMIVLVRNSEQEREWRHEQRNRTMIDDLREAEKEAALKQIQDFMGLLNDRFENFVATRFEDIKGLNSRVREIEESLDKEETTKP